MHRVQNELRPKVAQQVLNQVAAAIARITSVAIFAGAVEMVEAGQVRHRTGVDRGAGQPDEDRLIRLGWRFDSPGGIAGRRKTG